MRILSVCFLLLSLCDAVLSQPADVHPRYMKFINQHVNGQMSVNRCDSVIRSRHITTANSNECKETNTFIRATTNIIKPICGLAGEHHGELRKSLLPFDIVVCTLKNNGGRHPNCQYRGVSHTRKIAIACDRRYPVHYGRDIVYFQN